MLDGLLNRGFSSKCKSVIKATRTRIELVGKRADAKQRILKQDLAKLLANGLDINAYGRTEEYIAGMNLLSCYGFIEYTCDYIVKNLSILQKERECPEDCREAVASLMFAAARFSDLPELRDLRDIFQERYGSSLDCDVHQMFVDLLSPKPPTFEKGFQILQDLASEFSIKWDSRGFEQRMAAPPAFAQAQPTKHEPSSVAADKYGIIEGKASMPKSVRHKEILGSGKDGYNMNNCKDGKNVSREVLDHNFCSTQGRSNNEHIVPVANGESTKRQVKSEKLLKARVEVMVDKHEQSSKKDDTLFKAVKSGSSSHRKGQDDVVGGNVYQEYGVSNNKHEPSSKKDDTLFKAVKSGSSSHRTRHDNVVGGNVYQEYGISNDHENENRQPLSHRATWASPHTDGFPGKNDDMPTARKNKPTRSKGTDQEEDAVRLKSPQNALLPPPYVKSKNSNLPPPYVRTKDSKHRDSRKSEQPGSDFNGCPTEPSSRNTSSEVNGPRSSQRKHDSTDDEGQGHVRQTEMYYQNDQLLRKPRAARRKPPKSSSAAGHVEDDAGAMKVSSSSRRKESSRKGLQIVFDDDDEQPRKDDEEKMIDKLLMHYSKKPSTFDLKKLRKELQAKQPPPSNHISNAIGESSHEKARDWHHLSPDNVATTTRSISLPHDETFSAEHPKKVYTRANSFQPDGQAKHVHPKLPDYDDLAARFTALKGQ